MVMRLFCLLVLLSCAAVARAQMPVPDALGDANADARWQAAEAASQAYYTRVANALAAKGQPRQLAFAATLRQIATLPPAQAAQPGGDAPSQASPRDPLVAQWRSLASARAGKDVLANVLLMQADTVADAAVRSEAARRWQQVEPGNLAPLLFAGMPVGSLLAEARSRSGFDLHFYDQVRWMQSALLAQPPTAAERAVLGGEEAPIDEFAAIAASGIVAATAIPSLQPLVEGCRGAALSTTPTRRGDCAHVAALMADGSDTGIGSSVGLAMQAQLASNAAERAAVDARRRRFDWQMSQWGRVSAGQPRGGAAQFARLLRDPAIRTEQVLIERVLADAGVPLDPPAGWQMPQRER